MDPPTPDDTTILPPDPRLDDRVRELLETKGGRLAFNGLRRALGAHPESLTRALRRLERRGVVRHLEDGYSLVVPGERSRPSQPTPGRRSVASVQLPPGLSSDAVLGQLAGRWFGSLRWIGVYDRAGDPLLTWSVGTSPIRVLLSVRRGALRVLVEGESSSEATSPAAEGAAWELLRHALERLQPDTAPAGLGGGTHALLLQGADRQPFAG